MDDVSGESEESGPPSILAQLVRECVERGYSPTLETWNDRVRPVLERLAADESDRRSAEQASRVLAAWEESIEVVNRLWAEGIRDEPIGSQPAAEPEADGRGAGEDGPR